MKLIFFVAIILNVCALSAQNVQEGDDAIKLTTPAIIYYCPTSTLARMQSFVLADDHRGHVRLYNPSILAGYIVVFTDDTMKFISVNNDLGIVSSLRQNAIPSFDQQGAKVPDSQRDKVFLNCLVDGKCRLFKYNIGTGYAVKDDPENGDRVQKMAQGYNGTFRSARQNGESMMFTKTAYCIQKNEGRLIPLDNISIQSAFADCSETAGMSVKEILKDERRLKQLVIKYNKWRDSFDTNQRY